MHKGTLNSFGIRGPTQRHKKETHLHPVSPRPNFTPISPVVPMAPHTQKKGISKRPRDQSEEDVIEPNPTHPITTTEGHGDTMARSQRSIVARPRPSKRPDLHVRLYLIKREALKRTITAREDDIPLSLSNLSNAAKRAQ